VEIDLRTELRSMADKKTHFGRAGEYFAMSELLLRGWNVAVPVVDVGDDVLLIDDRDKTTWRVQVKTSATAPGKGKEGASPPLYAGFDLSRTQLRALHEIELFYMLVVRVEPRWRLLVVPRVDLLRIREAYVENARTRTGPGRRPLADEHAKTDALRLNIEIDGDEVTGWDSSLSKYADRWPDDLPIVLGGPGSVGASAAPDANPPSSGDPDPSLDPET
jgi:hypothetical protein